jgi:hypothetical protein
MWLVEENSNYGVKPLFVNCLKRINNHQPYFTKQELITVVFLHIMQID